MGVGSVRESWGWRPDFQPWKPWGGNGNQFDGRAYVSNGLVKNHQLISVEIGEPFFLTILKLKFWSHEDLGLGRVPLRNAIPLLWSPAVWKKLVKVGMGDQEMGRIIF